MPVAIRMLVIPLFLSSMQMAMAVSPDSAGRAYVRVEATFAQATLAHGARGEILVRLAPVEGIHINAEPAPEFTLDGDSVVSLVGRPSFKRNAKGYFAPGNPLRQRVAVTKNATGGAHTIKGTLVFFYCSDAEGWCMRARQALELTLTVGK